MIPCFVMFASNVDGNGVWERVRGTKSHKAKLISKIATSRGFVDVLVVRL